MDELEIRPHEASEASEKPENAAEQELDDATLEPRTFVEQSGDFKQAEAIQGNITALVDNVAIVAPIEVATGGVVKGSGGEQVGITPINLPREADQASGANGNAGSGAEQVGITPINLPRVADGTTREYQDFGGQVANSGVKSPGGGVEDGIIPMPIPGGQMNFEKISGEGVETALPGSIEIPTQSYEKTTGDFNQAKQMQPGEQVGAPQQTTEDVSFPKEPGRGVEVPVPISEKTITDAFDKSAGAGVETPLPDIAAERLMTGVTIEQVVARTERFTTKAKGAEVPGLTLNCNAEGMTYQKK
jgi:hypothetical protein